MAFKKYAQVYKFLEVLEKLEKTIHLCFNKPGAEEL